MRRSLIAIVLFSYLLFVASANTSQPTITLEPFDAPNFYHVEHSFDLGNTWRLRGTLRYHTQQKKFYFKPLQNKWTQELLSPISSANTLYQIRFISSTSTSSIIQTSISLCDLVESNFREEFRIVAQGLQLQSVQYSVMGLATRRLLQPQQQECLQNVPSVTTLVQLNLKQHVKVVLQPTTPYKPIDERNFAVQADGISVKANAPTTTTTTTTEEEPGFLRKYWMYIIPGVLIFIVMSAMGNPQ